MTYNKNGIPINRRERLFENVFEYTFAPGAIKKYYLDKKIRGIIVVVKGFKEDILYISDNPSKVSKQIRTICGETMQYGCVALEQKGA